MRLLLVLVITLTGCQTSGVQAPAVQPKYELTLGGSVDGAPFTGIAVGSSARHHDIVITSAVSVNYFTVQSCHRSLQFADVIQLGWFDHNKSYAWSYDESPTIEDSGQCILRFCAYSKTVGSPPVACSIVDFKSSNFTLPGENICNGADGATTGTALCHSRVGLIQRFRFAGPVFVAPMQTDASNAPYWIANQCVGKFLDDKQTLFEYVIPSSECVVLFMETAKPHRVAKLTVLPFDTAQYQGAN